MAFSTNQVAEFLGIRTETVVRLVQNAKLKAHRHSDGKRWLIEEEDLAHFIVANNDYKRRFFSYMPKRGQFLNSYRVLRNEVNRLL